ncbi:hypothetical protein ACFQVA_12610 [Actinomadura keratinilytica]
MHLHARTVSVRVQHHPERVSGLGAVADGIGDQFTGDERDGFDMLLTSDPQPARSARLFVRQYSAYHLAGAICLKSLGGAFALSKLSRLENARNAAKPADIDRLLALYAKLGRDVDDELRAALLDLTKAGSQRGWWHSYRGVVGLHVADGDHSGTAPDR